jgi:uncharacterized protein YraI
MQIDRNRFVDGYQAAFSTTLSASQGAGLKELLTAAEGDPQITDLRWLAYMLATVKHECADRWKPIEEFGKGKGRKYGVAVTVTDAQGQKHTNVYYGRGYVQLTWDFNYKQMGEQLGNRLLFEPELALDAGIAYRIMSLGMRKGFFTGKKLADYINGDKADYFNARRIINGVDQADRIAGYARKLEQVLRGSVVAAIDGVPVVPATPAGGARFTVTASSLNVRSGPGASHPAVAGSPLPQGTAVQGVEDEGGWKRVVAEGTINGVAGITGWVSAQFLAPAAAPAPAPLFTVTATSLNVRSGPGASNPAVAGSPLPGGTVVAALEERDGWKRVAVQGTVNGVANVTGWVSAQFLQSAVPAPV